MVVGVMMAIVVMAVAVVHMLVLVAVMVLVLIFAMVMMVVRMLMLVLDSSLITVEPGHVVVVVLELLSQLNIKVAGVDAMLVYA